MSIDPSDKPIYTLNHLLRDMEVGRRFHADAALMPGIDRLEVLCDEAFKGTGLTIANVRQIRADLCKEMHCSPQVAGDFSLPDVVNVLTGVCRWSLPEFFDMLRRVGRQRIPSVFYTSVLLPATTLDTICDLNLDVHRADCRIVKGTEPSVCPKADPPLPAEYLPIVFKDFKELNLIPAGHTIHWIGLKAWRRNLCECFPVKASEADGNAKREQDADEKTVLTPRGREDLIQHMEPAVRLAYLAFMYAEAKAGKSLEDRAAYEFLKEEGIAENAGDRGELTDYELPSSDTWSRHLRNARKALGEQKYNRRNSRPIGKSIARANQIEPPKDKGS